ncbi:hypothetical protein VOLCADRAFT_99694 [Volvox carteri f. nagariensis]|uniref:Uncharacterized protein n=1 Tax=Volvox carteri f. nagariensis TaxID=3068 RepID=D8UIE3_VOLCA|nr:uncharacterized protein VOLCADRAFT_99694 [Volvox carteri f. nagariensis]EFJ40514.1 hypothetical protein VOLCADRAFT_99694 [Volvox carteri f. nagariensis]|eukprot:XP_002958438.1 hypothetical protein VOLCADRAFT_99694 [Volvox carteri f. nagariensis]
MKYTLIVKPGQHITPFRRACEEHHSPPRLYSVPPTTNCPLRSETNYRRVGENWLKFFLAKSWLQIDMWALICIHRLAHVACAVVSLLQIHAVYRSSLKKRIRRRHMFRPLNAHKWREHVVHTHHDTIRTLIRSLRRYFAKSTSSPTHPATSPTTSPHQLPLNGNRCGLRPCSDLCALLARATDIPPPPAGPHHHRWQGSKRPNTSS